MFAFTGVVSSGMAYPRMEFWYNMSVMLGPGTIVVGSNPPIVPPGGQLRQFQASLLRGSPQTGYRGTIGVLTENEPMVYVVFGPIEVTISQMLPAPDNLDQKYHNVSIMLLAGGKIIVTTT